MFLNGESKMSRPLPCHCCGLCCLIRSTLKDRCNVHRCGLSVVALTIVILVAVVALTPIASPKFCVLQLACMIISLHNLNRRA